MKEFVRQRAAAAILGVEPILEQRWFPGVWHFLAPSYPDERERGWPELTWKAVTDVQLRYIRKGRAQRPAHGF